MAILNYLGLGGRAPPVEEKKGPTPVRALPANWYNTQEMFELEKRAIFSRKWQLITHKSRLPNPGDWLKFDIVGFEFIIAKDRKNEINAFHNVCRHRAFPVLQGDAGNAKILACKYHGWSYGLDGKLAKAPKYDELEDFDKSQNGLFKIHTHVDINGFIWVNLDAKPVPEVAWEDDFLGIDEQERLKQYNFDDYVLDHEYKMDGDYNWKILADNFNECYHCPTAHPDIPQLADIETHDVTKDNISILHQSAQNEEQKRDGLAISSTYFFPNVSISVLPHFIMLQRFLPISPSKSSMHYQIYRNKKSADKDFQLISQLYARVVAEDKDLCRLAQKNLNAGIFVNGELHPRLEKGPLLFQQADRDTIRAHVEREKAEGREIWPARQQMSSAASAAVSREDIELCSGLACNQTNQAALVW